MSCGEFGRRVWAAMSEGDVLLLAAGAVLLPEAEMERARGNKHATTGETSGGRRA